MKYIVCAAIFLAIIIPPLIAEKVILQWDNVEIQYERGGC